MLGPRVIKKLGPFNEQRTKDHNQKNYLHKKFLHLLCESFVMSQVHARAALFFHQITHSRQVRREKGATIANAHVQIKKKGAFLE
jgi:hypothetical protein